MVKREWPKENGQKRMAKREWPKENGQKRMAKREWPTENGQNRLDHAVLKAQMSRIAKTGQMNLTVKIAKMAQKKMLI